MLSMLLSVCGSLFCVFYFFDRPLLGDFCDLFFGGGDWFFRRDDFVSSTHFQGCCEGPLA